MVFGGKRVRACRASAWVRGGVPVLGAMGLMAVPYPVLAQVVPPRPPVAPSQVTPRSLMPPPSVTPPSVELPFSLPSEAPPGADTTAVTVGAVVVSGGYPELAAQTRALFAPLEGKPTTLGALYRAAAALESAYSRRGYFLVRVVVPQQRIATGETFRVTIVDGFIESLNAEAVPKPIRRPVQAIMRGIVGQRQPTLDDMRRRLDLAGALPGARLRSTLAKGEQPGGALLILDGGFKPYDLTISGDNRLGPSFNTWGLNLQGSLNSPSGHGEQIYAFLSGQPRLDENFRRAALRRVIGGGFSVPLTDWGLAINPEVTVSDTNPKVGNPLFASKGTLRRGVVNLIAPVAISGGGSLVTRLTLDITRQRQTLPVFDFILSDDRLTVIRANVTWRGALWHGATASASATFSRGIGLFGAYTPSRIVADRIATSRGSNPQFRVADFTGVVQQALPGQAMVSGTYHVQTSFGGVLPNSETFDPTGLDGLSSFTAGALISDGGASLRGELSRPFTVGKQTRLTGVPYIFVAGAALRNITIDGFSPSRATAFGSGIRLFGDGLPLGAAPSATLELGRGWQNRGAPADTRLMASFGVRF